MTPKYNKTCFHIACLIIGTSSTVLMSQIPPKGSSNELKSIQNSILKTEQLIKNASVQKNAGLKQLELLQSQISYRTELQIALQEELKKISKDLQSLKVESSEQLKLMQKQQSDYFLLLKQKFIHRKTFNPLLSLIQPVELESKMRRWYILQHLENKIKFRLEELRRTNDAYNEHIQQLNKASFINDSLITASKVEQDGLLKDKNQIQKLIADLSSQSAGLNSSLVEYKRKKEELRKLIAGSIEKMPASTFKKTNLKVALQFPMEYPTIISRFGNNMETGRSKLVIRNNGIDLQSTNPFVTAALDAEIIQIKKMPSQQYLIITRADQLYLVYSNLKNVLLKEGDKIQQGANLGQASMNENGQYELHFETWEGRKAVNPMQFLK